MIMQDAYAAAQMLLDAEIRPGQDEEVVICSCTEYPTAWVFGYNTRRFLLELDLTASLVGNGPVVVPKSGGAPFLGIAGNPIEGQFQDP